MTKEEYNKHKKLIEEWGNGKQIQYYSEDNECWMSIQTPSWRLETKYRIKPTKIEFIDCDFDDEEYSINEWGNISIIKPKDYKFEHRVNFIKDRKIAEAYSVLPKLIRLMNKYNEGWKPDWNNKNIKYTIEKFNTDLIASTTYNSTKLITFKSEETRDRFFEDHRDLIEIAKPFL